MKDIAPHHHQQSSSTIIINNHHQQSSSTIIINNHHQQSSSTIIINNHHQQSPSTIIIIESSPGRCHIMITPLTHYKTQQHGNRSIRHTTTNTLTSSHCNHDAFLKQQRGNKHPKDVVPDISLVIKMKQKG
jgi:hypothetical protein